MKSFYGWNGMERNVFPIRCITVIRDKARMSIVTHLFNCFILAKMSYQYFILFDERKLPADWRKDTFEIAIP